MTFSFAAQYRQGQASWSPPPKTATDGGRLFRCNRKDGPDPPFGFLRGQGGDFDYTAHDLISARKAWAGPMIIASSHCYVDRLIDLRKEAPGIDRNIFAQLIEPLFERFEPLPELHPLV